MFKKTPSCPQLWIKHRSNSIALFGPRAKPDDSVVMIMYYEKDGTNGANTLSILVTQ